MSPNEAKYARFLAKSLLGKKIIYPDWQKNILVKAKATRTRGFAIILDNKEIINPKEIITSKRKFEKIKKILAARRIASNKKEIWKIIEEIKNKMDIIEQAEKEIK